MADAALAELLADAKLVAAHGARTGTLAADSGLFVATAAAAAQPQLDWSSPEAARLQAELAAALRQIRPVSLHDLKSGWRADVEATGPGRRLFGWARRTVVLGLTLAVMWLCANLTVWQQKATSLIAEMSQNKAALQEAAFDEMLLLISGFSQAFDDGDMADSAGAAARALRDKEREIERLELSMAYDELRYTELREDYFLDDWLAGAAALAEPAAWRAAYDRTRAALGLCPECAEEARPRVILDDLPMSALLHEVQRRYESSAYEPAPCAPASPAGGAADPAKVAAVIGSGDPVLVFKALHDDYVDEVNQIKCLFQLQNVVAVDDEDRRFKGKIRDIAAVAQLRDVYATWLLPAFYGMLGALIYHLRVYLLGGFAGIAIGWFWVPQSGAAPTVPELPVTGMALAFLVGFSIDVFLGFLDRLVTLMNRWVGTLGAEAK